MVDKSFFEIVVESTLKYSGEYISNCHKPQGPMNLGEEFEKVF